MAAATTTDAPDISNESFTLRMLFNTIRAKFPHACQLSTETLQLWLNDENTAKSVLLLDVRESEEYEISTMPNTIHVLPSQNDLSFVLDKIKNSGISKVVAFCSLGYRSSMMAQKIYTELKTDPDFNISSVEIYNLEGSIFKWANEDRKVVDKDGHDTKFVHPYNMVWGKFLDSEKRKYPASK